MSDTNDSQKAQDLIALEVEVEGFEDWRDALAKEKVELSKIWAKEAGKSKVSLLEACDITARLSCISREIVYFSELINVGYVLEEAVVTFDSEKWGRFGKCTWIKNPKEMSSDPEAFWHKVMPNASDYEISLASALFDTEKAGKQRVTLSSVNFTPRFLFHKTLRFHRMVFSKPK